jgi:8-oxo-dGTP diphosphatase
MDSTRAVSPEDASTELHSVKALIYRDDGSILLQQRDRPPFIPYPEHWTFFGGQVETGESLAEALERELREELGCLPGPIGEELCNWLWVGERTVRNHCLAVFCAVDPNSLELHEGQGMAWYHPSDAIKLQLIPGLRSQMSLVRNFLDAVLVEKAGL